MPVSTLDIADKRFLEAEGEDHKIVGGCGVDLSSVIVAPISFDNENYHRLIRSVLNEETETAHRCEIKQKPYYAFKVKLADHLSNEPQHYQRQLTPLIPITAAESEESVIADIAEDKLIDN